MEKRVQLKNNWKLRWAENRDVEKLGMDFKTVKQLEKTSLPCIKASVPGNFELDFQRAGIIDDPFWSDNIVKLRKYENLHLWYYTTFDLPEDFCGRFILDFEGIDTIAEIYLNGQYANADNMLIPHRFDFTEDVKLMGNSLVVHILPTAIMVRNDNFTAAQNAMQYEAASLGIRKAASTFGWDIIARTVSGGLWKPVYLIDRQFDRIDEAYLYTTGVDTKNKIADVNLFFKVTTTEDFIEDMFICVEGVCGESKFFAKKNLWHTAGTLNFRIENAEFWMPKNYGQPNLYDVKVTLVKGDKVYDEKNIRFGVRTVELKRTSVERQPDSQFCFFINGQRVFCLGTNWVPLDAYHSRDIERLPMALELLDGVGCNTIRCWGGNVYENDELYDWCDSHGVMIWQDFGMGCGVYPQDEYMQDTLAEEAESVIKRLRNHPSLILWAGDNEVDYAYSWNRVRRDPNENILTRKVLRDAVREHDVVRPYLPSSPYLDEVAFSTGLPPTEDHLWGPRDYFKGDYYKNTECHFASETGYHGCPAPESLKKFIAPDQLFPIFDKDGAPNADWVYHGTSMDNDRYGNFGYRTELMVNQVKVLFGGMPDDLDTFAYMSQISQAEAFKYFIERFRLRKWRRTGIIWWNLLDGWPQVSDAIVDYYGTKKLAYSYIKRSQNPVCLMFDEPEDGYISLYGVNDTQSDVKVNFDVFESLGGGKNTDVLSDTAVIPANESVVIGKVKINDGDGQQYFGIRWNGGFNHFVTNLKGSDYQRYTEFMKENQMNEWYGFGGSENG